MRYTYLGRIRSEGQDEAVPYKPEISTGHYHRNNETAPRRFFLRLKERMLSYFSTSPVTAAKIIAIQRTSTAYDAGFILICEAPDVSSTAATFETVTQDWMTENGAVVGGYLVVAGAVRTFIPAAPFVALYPPVLVHFTASTAQGSTVSATGTVTW